MRSRGEAGARDVARCRPISHLGTVDSPLFLPAFHAPDIARDGGWHIVIMNPPYVGRKKFVAGLRTDAFADLEQHYGRTFDLMLHFAFRALELTRPGGIVSMIFNDSIFSSIDATEFRLSSHRRRRAPARDGSHALLRRPSGQRRRSCCREGEARRHSGALDRKPRAADV